MDGDLEGEGMRWTPFFCFVVLLFSFFFGDYSYKYTYQVPIIQTILLYTVS